MTEQSMADIPEYQWTPWPEGLFTARQLAGDRLTPGPVRGKIWMAKHGKWLLLYRKEEATAKSERTPAQVEAATKTAEALRTGWTCHRCGGPLRRYVKGGGVCRDCQRELEQEAQREIDQAAIAEWAYDLLRDPAGFVVLDTETTGLSAARACQIAVVDQSGVVLLNTLVQPGKPMPAEATRIHGITDAMLTTAPGWTQVELLLRAAITARRVLIYNADYDVEVLANMIVDAGGWAEAGVRAYLGAAGQAQCVMLAYAQFVGETRRDGSYRWHKLDDAAWGADVQAPAHSALGDCLRTLHVVKQMAAWYEVNVLNGAKANV